MPYIHLLKVLYIADREYLAEHGYMITGDKVVAMTHGPVLSRILNMIKGRARSSGIWQASIKTSGKYNIRLVSDPGDGDLSRAITAKLDVVFGRFGKLEPFRVVQLTHDFPEWSKHYTVGTSTLIPWQEILRAQGKEQMEPIATEQIKLQAHQQALRKAANETR